MIEHAEALLFRLEHPEGSPLLEAFADLLGYRGACELAWILEDLARRP